MTSLEIRRENIEGAVTLKLKGTFDNRTALELRRTLELVDEAEVVLDFGGVGQFSDSAVAVLSRGIKHVVTLKGLGHHHQRIFAYLGMMPVMSVYRGYDPSDELLAG